MKWLWLGLLTLVMGSAGSQAASLRWAADAESGAPFVFYDPQDQEKMLGFEYEIMIAVARVLQKDPRFVQNAWDGLIPGLQRDEYDVVINGVEITPDREREILFSRPYFVTFEQLVVRQDQEGLQTLKDCYGRKVGTLKLSVAERILQQHPQIQIVGYEAETNAFEDLKHGRTDAALLDSPIAQYYAEPDPQLKLVGEPFGKIFYGIGMSKKNAALKAEIDGALKSLQESGELRQIFDRWKLWSSVMAEYFKDHSAARVEASQYQYFLSQKNTSRTWAERLSLYKSVAPILIKGAWVTLQLSMVAMVIAMILGLLLALARLYGPSFVSYAAITYIEFIRGTPLLIQLFFLYYALPHIGIKLSPWTAAVLGLGLNYAANEAENYRAGIQGIAKGQTEAALAMGMNNWQAISHVILPQAMRIVIPPVTNDFIALLKDSSLVSVITMVELTKLYGQLASTYYDYIGIGLLVAICYLLLGLPFVRLARHFERQIAKRYGVPLHRH